MTRAYNTATTQQNSGGAVPAFLAGKNKLINGDFGIWQRGTSVSLTTNAGAFLADRFLCNWAGTFTGTMSQQTFTPGTAPVAGYEGQYFLRINRTGTTSVAPTFYQRVEDVRTFAGQTTTFSFWAKADTSRSVSLNYFQSFGSGGSSAVSGSIGTVALTTSWQRFSLTFTLPSVAGKTIGTSSWVTPYFDLPDSTAFTFDTWGHQWEAGSVATPFQTATGSTQGELAACQRYYFRMNANNTYSPFGSGNAGSATLSYIMVNHPVPMRTVTSSVDFSNLAVTRFGSPVFAVTAIALQDKTTNITLISTTNDNSSYTAGSYCALSANNSTSAFIGFSAEL